MEIKGIDNSSIGQGIKMPKEDITAIELYETSDVAKTASNEKQGNKTAP